MIQRLQSVYLLIAAILHGLLFFIPLFVAGVLPTGTPSVNLDITSLTYGTTLENMGVIQNGLTIWMMIVNGLIIALCLFDIFLFRKRMLQLRISRFIGLAIVILIGVTFYASEQAKSFLLEKVGNTTQVVSAYKPGIWLPLISLILIILAGRGIIKDERLVRSADRLR